MANMEEDRVAVTRACRYALQPARINNEDILFCIDVDAESTVEMKTTGVNGKPLIRMECVKQAIILFIHNKLAINPDHRFAFAALTKSAAWLKKDFTSDAASAVACLNGLSASKSSGQADLTLLFRAAAQEAKISRAQNRIFRVILIYCRSSVRPTYEWPLKQKLFSLDVLYLHDKPGPENCPQDVYDSLVDAVEHVSEYEGYIFESGLGVARLVFKPMSILLAHPQQRCVQDDLDIPGSLSKKVPVTAAANLEDPYNGNNVQTISQ